MGSLRPFLATLLLLVAGGAEIVGIHAAMMPYRTGAGMFFGWLLCLAALAVTAGAVTKVLLGKGGLLLPTVLLLAITSCLYGVLGGQLPRLLFVRETGVISVTEADLPAHRSSHVFHFSDGRVHPGYHWTRSIGTKMNAGSYHVAPVVPGGWKPSDPITLWAVGEGAGRFPSDAWQKTGGGAYRAVSDATYRDMIEKGIADRRLVSRPDAPLVFLDDRPREALRSTARFELWGLLAVSILSLAFPALPLLRRKPAAS